MLKRCPPFNGRSNGCSRSEWPKPEAGLAPEWCILRERCQWATSVLVHRRAGTEERICLS